MKIFTAHFTTRSFYDPVTREHAPIYLVEKINPMDKSDKGYRIKWNLNLPFDSPKNETHNFWAESERDAVEAFTRWNTDSVELDIRSITEITI